MHFGQVGTDFITQSGFLEIAEANNIILIFPQVRETRECDTDIPDSLL